MARRSLRDEFLRRHGNRPAQMATYESDNDPRYGNAPTREEQQWINEGNRKSEIVTKPTRDLNDDRVWTGGSRDFDERTGTNRPGHRDGDSTFFSFEERERGGGKRPGHRDRPNLIRDIRRSGEIPQDWDRKDPTQDISRERPKPKRDWWNEPKKEYRPEKSAKERRLELLTGGGGRRSSDTDRYSLLTGRGLSSNEDRMAMLTGRSDPPKEEWKSQYGGRREYDPQDREFNRQFNTEPTANRDVLSQFRTEGSTGGYPVPTFKDQVDHMKKDYDQGGDIQREIGEWTGIKGDVPRNVGEESTSSKPKQYWEGGRKYETIPATFNDNYYGEGKRGMVAPEMRTEITPQAKYDDSSIKERLRALENRSPIVNQPTVDLSGVEERISQLEGKKPQDLSGIQGRLSELEGKGPSWQEDRVKQLEGSRSESKSARNLLDQRIASLENYYKNDPPPAESTGNRYEDKMANLNKLWERTGKAQSWGDDAMLEPQKNKKHWDYSSGYADKYGRQWAKDLPTGYVEGIRNLNREYNKPVHEAIIKGQEYKAYDPRAAARLRFLDEENIHEDTYLGRGDWDDKYGEKVYGRGLGDQDRYFISQSGLEKDSDEYKDRFTNRYGNMGKDYAWYK